ncbi:fibrinogen alpha chain [Amia ocellicauda]|uniref:fibrinogen alpha chain n=1 Tax=Amia ocellicauda TaxID=2972642 RepID=UPI00346417E0|nr:FIBA protein [Amia calva]
MAPIRLACAMLLVLASARANSEFAETGASGRGTRPVQQNLKAASTGCTIESLWPICTDEEWGPKCPSGCRLQGLLSKTDEDFAKKIDRIRKLLDENRTKYRSTDELTKTTYTFLRDRLVTDSGNDNRFMSLADQLRQRIISMKLKIDDQSSKLVALKRRVQEQVTEMHRLEVDIDIKIRACKGSCESSYQYTVDRDSYTTLEKQLSNLDSISLQSVETVSSLRVMKMRRLKEDGPGSSIYKSVPVEGGEQQKTFFSDVEKISLSLEAGDTSSKGGSSVKYTPGTEKLLSGSKDDTVTSSSGSSVTTHTHVVKCTKTITKKTTVTKDGTVETMEVVGASPECDRFSGVDDATLLASAKEGKGLSDGFTMKVSGSSGGVDSISERFPEFDHFFTGHGSSTSRDLGGGSTTFTTFSEHTDQPSRVVKTVTHTSGRGDGPADVDFLNLGHTGDGDFHTDFFPSGVPGGVKESSSSYTKTTVVSSGGTKGSQMFMGDDLGPFMRGYSEDDEPDFHARSLKREKVKLQRDYIGTDCDDVRQKHESGHKSGLFKIRPEGTKVVKEVYCDQDTLLGGWALVQQRMDGSVDFNRTWAEYRRGFGAVDEKGVGEVWLGNEFLHLLTQKESLLRVELEDWEGHEAYAEYTLSVGPESEGYLLKVSSYSGDAGDALIRGQPDMGQFLSHNNMKFSTYDRDSDKWEENCAEMYGGGWWYNNCRSANLNGVYYTGGQYDPGTKVPYEIENGVVWLSFKPADYSLKVVRMKVRPMETQ